MKLILFLALLPYARTEIVIEHHRGSIRSGIDRKGKKWKMEMKHHYGYFKNTKGADGKEIDVYVGRHLHSPHVFIITQLNPFNGKFDEHKVMIGFLTEQQAKLGYLIHFPKNWKGYGGIRKIKKCQLKAWIGNRRVFP